MDTFIKNIEHAKVFDLANIVSYESGKIVSTTLSQTTHVGITLFAFAAGEGVNTHAAPGDAMVVILDGEAEVIIDKTPTRVSAGETIIMPAGIPHAVKAITDFKMMLTVVK